MQGRANEKRRETPTFVSKREKRFEEEEEEEEGFKKTPGETS